MSYQRDRLLLRLGTLALKEAGSSSASPTPNASLSHRSILSRYGASRKAVGSTCAASVRHSEQQS